MGLDIFRDKNWMKMCIKLWKEVEELFNVSLESVVTSNA